MAKAAGTAGQDKARGPRSSALRRVAEHDGGFTFCLFMSMCGCVCMTHVSLCLRDGQRPCSDAIHFVFGHCVCVCVCMHAYVYVVYVSVHACVHVCVL